MTTQATRDPERRQKILSPEVARVKAAMIARADELAKEASDHEVGTFAYLISNRMSMEFRHLAEELHFH